MRLTDRLADVFKLFGPTQDRPRRVRVVSAAALAQACTAGRAVRAREGEGLVVPARLVRELCRGGREQVDPRGLTIEGARV
ncbi:hypothetical protein [Planotetraspora kaengkrachanensis]|uniref:Uncharacterized protein n=1 Tax=Planotetraspora kaengkrachanensis TaxID=575193 RepID=A0A8J3LX37_9ACTN|nr:hypothetical protein [Planotetraspora kaengkrachanensis]GIG80077.1 hypothetical protein Pka01_32040 [Planotetraspora kaengkrachanensis]